MTEASLQSSALHPAYLRLVKSGSFPRSLLWSTWRETQFGSPTARCVINKSRNVNIISILYGKFGNSARSRHEEQYQFRIRQGAMGISSKTRD